MLPLIPYPSSCEERDGAFRWTPATVCRIAPELSAVKPFFEEELLQHADFTLQEEGADASVELRYAPSLPEGGYTLSCSLDRLVLSASGPCGAFYGLQTLRQLGKTARLERAPVLSFPCVEIEDAPAFSWRGLMLDSSRHFWEVEEVKRLLDQMASYKLNVFHWHLTDDNGWRVEIKKYPLLTEIGSKRKGTHINGWHKPDMDPTPYGGFYSQEEIRDIVDYAAKRYIMVVPEIDMPAHFRAAIAAYPWLACREIESEVPWYFATPDCIPGSKEDYARIACAGKETTYAFIRDVIDELCGMFPAPYFHIGGDEAPKDEWKKCPACQETIRAKGLKNEEELQGHFNAQIASYLEQKEKRLICWNDALRSDYPALKNMIGQYYTAGKDPYVLEHLKKGGNVIISRYSGFYYDMSYAQIPTKNVCNFKLFQNKEISETYTPQVLGCEGTLWTEWIADREKLDLNLHPRMEAMAEKCWLGTKAGTFRQFVRRWKLLRPSLEKQGIGYACDAIAFPNNPVRKSKMAKIWNWSDPYVEVKFQKEKKL